MRKLAGVVPAAAVFVLQAIPAAAAYEAYVVVQGLKQGQHKGEVLQHAAGRQPALEFTYAAQSPRDAATGQASGKRQYKPVTIVKEWGALSPGLGSGEINCNAIMIAATLPDGRRVDGRPVVPVRPGECRYAIGLPSSTPVRTFLQVTAPGITGPWTFQAAPTAVEIGAGQALSARLSAQAFGDGGRFSLAWGPASPQLFTARAPARMPVAGSPRH